MKKIALLLITLSTLMLASCGGSSSSDPKPGSSPAGLAPADRVSAIK